MNAISANQYSRSYLWDYVPLVSTGIFLYEKIQGLSLDSSPSIDPQRVYLVNWSEARRIVAALPLVINNLVVAFVDVLLYLIDPPKSLNKNSLPSPVVSKKIVLTQLPLLQESATITTTNLADSFVEPDVLPSKTQEKSISKNPRQILQRLVEPEIGVGTGLDLEEDVEENGEVYSRPSFRLPENQSGLIDEELLEAQNQDVLTFTNTDVMLDLAIQLSLLEQKDSLRQTDSN